MSIFRLIFTIFVILYGLTTTSIANIFSNYSELSECIDNHSSYQIFKNNLKNCYQKKNIDVSNEMLNKIQNKSSIIDDIIKIDYDVVKKENEISLRNFFSSKKPETKKDLLTNRNIKNLKRHIKKYPEDIYGITEDINKLTYDKKYISSFKRSEILLNVYNSFDINIFRPKPKLDLTKQSFPTAAGTSGIGVLGAIGAIGLAGAGGGGGGGGSSSSTPATISYAVSSQNVHECGTSITITASLTKAHSSNVTISYSTSGTATSGVDYNLSSSSSTIVSGGTSASITMSPVNDTTNETSETVIISASATGVSSTGNTSTTVTIHDYVLACNSTAYSEDTSVQNTIKNRSAWTTVDQSGNSLHPYELVNLHKAHSFKDSNNQYLTGEGETIYIVDDKINKDHASFNNKTFTEIDVTSPSNNTYDHGTHVASIAAGDINGTTHGVAPDADIVFSSFSSGSGSNWAGDLDNARTNHSPIAANNSWGWSDGWNGSNYTSAVTVTEVETAATNNSVTIRTQLANYFGSGTNVSDYITALDNFQDNGVIVFASSNYVNDTDVSFMGGLPYFIDGTKDTVDLSDAWLSVMYAEFTGSSLSGASTSDFNRLGNPCGNAKEWCLVVDDAQIAAAGYVDVNGTSQYSTLSGSSMGAPQVSGMIALLGQAFPNHTPEQLTDRLLASANNLWFTPSGNTTFTTHGASIKHGYNDTWGHGVPDLYAALSPITTDKNALSFGGGGGGGGSGGGGGGSSMIPFKAITKYAVGNTKIKSSSSLGDAIYKGLQNKTTYAYDALHGGFQFNVSDFIDYENLNNQKITTSIKKEFENLSTFKYSGVRKNKSLTSYNGEFFNFRDKQNDGFSVTLDQPNIALQNYNFYNNKFYENPFSSVNKGVGFNNKISLLGNDILFGYSNSKINPLTNINHDLTIPIETLAVSTNINNNVLDLFTLTSGLMKEESTFLLSEGSGAFKMSNESNYSTFYGVNLGKNFNNFGNLYFNAMIGKSSLKNEENSFVVSTSEVYSSSYEINYEMKNLLNKDVLNISLSQPNIVESGNMRVGLLGLNDRQGLIPYNIYEISLEPSGRQTDLTLSYYSEPFKNIKTGFKAVVTDDLGHVKNQNLSTNFIFTAKLSF